MKIVLVLVLVLAPRADASPDLLVHADAGVEMEGNATVSSTTFRAQALAGYSFGSGRLRPELAAGATFGAGELYAPDPRAVDGSVGLSMTTFGPEAQLALQLYNDNDEPTTRVFASLAYLHVSLDDRLMIDPVPGVGGDRGARATVGVNVARTIARHLECTSRESCDGWLYLFLPQQVELTNERDGGSARYGVTLSWGS